MKNLLINLITIIAFLINFSCSNGQPEVTENSAKAEKAEVKEEEKATAQKLLGHPKYPAISYGGYRQNSREVQPTVAQLKEDMKILAAMGIRILRTYNVNLPHASNVLKAISELKKEDPNFEMYVMLGAWINCLNAWTGKPNHEEEDIEGNEAEIQQAIALTNQYPDIVKVIAVGNEAMVHWAASYFVRPNIILKWVNHLQGLKQTNHQCTFAFFVSCVCSMGFEKPRRHKRK